MVGDLLRHEVAARDPHLLLLGVARDLDDLHSVTQRRRDRVQDVRGRDEQDLGEIECHVDVVVPECHVLFGVEHLEQRGGRIAAEVHAELVHLVQHEHRVLRFGPAQALDDLPRQRADIRSPVTADLRLVAHAAERDPVELPAERPRDRPAERGLADARGADEAQDRILPGRAHALHREVFEDTFLHLLETGMILVEDPPRLVDVEVVGRLLAPRQRHQPVEIGPRDRVFRRGRRHLTQAVQLAQGLLLSFLGHPGRLDLRPQLVQLLGAVVGLPELLLDRLELLAQVVLTLAPADLRLDLRLDLGAEGQHLGFLRQHRDEAGEPRLDVRRLQELLLHLRREHGQRGGDEVAEPVGLGDVLRDRRQFVGQHRGQLHHLAEQVRRVPRQRFRFEIPGGRRELRHLHDPGGEIRAHLHHLRDADAMEPLHDQAHGSIRLLQHLVHGGQGADPVQIGLLRILGRRIPLGEDPDQAVSPDHVFEQLHRRLAAGPQRQGRLRKEHGVAQGQDRHLLRNRRPRAQRHCARQGHLVVCHGDGLPSLKKDQRARAGWMPPGRALRSGRAAPRPASPPCRFARDWSTPRSAPACRACGASSLG